MKTSGSTIHQSNVKKKIYLIKIARVTACQSARQVAKRLIDNSSKCDRYYIKPLPLFALQQNEFSNSFCHIRFWLGHT